MLPPSVTVTVKSPRLVANVLPASEAADFVFTVVAINPSEWDGKLKAWYDRHYPRAEYQAIETRSPWEMAIQLLPPLKEDIALAQTDPRWAAYDFGEHPDDPANGETIGGYGCFLIGLAIILRKVYQRDVTPPTLVRLATIPTVAAVKEASGNINQISEVCRTVPDDFIVLSGDDAMTVPAMAVGARGLISVASNEAPAEMALMVGAAEKGDFADARERHMRLLPLMNANFAESNPIPVKTALAMMGKIEEAFRLPMCELSSQEHRQALEGVLKQLGLV